MILPDYVNVVDETRAADDLGHEKPPRVWVIHVQTETRRHGGVEVYVVHPLDDVELERAAIDDRFVRDNAPLRSSDQHHSLDLETLLPAVDPFADVERSADQVLVRDVRRAVGIRPRS